MTITARKTSRVDFPILVEVRDSFGSVYATEALTRPAAVELAEQLAEVTGTAPDTITVRAVVANDEEESRAGGRQWEEGTYTLPSWCAGAPAAALCVYLFGYMPAEPGRLVRDARIVD